MSERLTDEQLRDWRDEAEIGAMMSPFETLSVLDALEALRARVAQLEAALRDCKRYAEDHDDEWVPFRVDDALRDAPK